MRFRTWAPLAVPAFLAALAPLDAGGALPQAGQRYFGSTSQGALVVAQASGSRRRLTSLDLDVVARCQGRRLVRHVKGDTLYLEDLAVGPEGAFGRSGRILAYNSGPEDAGSYPVRVTGQVGGRFISRQRLTGTAELTLRGTFFLGGGEGEGFDSERATCRTGSIRFSARAPGESRSRAGALTEVPSAGGCVFARRRRTCTHHPLVGAPDDILISRDGRHLYALSSDTNYNAWLVGFRRSLRTGMLTAIPGEGACVRADPAAGCTVARGLHDVAGAAISPDSRSVYMIGTDPPAVAVLTRDRGTGRLTQPPDSAGCLGAAEDGCAPLPPLGDVSNIAVSPDGKQVYLAFDGATRPYDRGVLWLPRRRGGGALGPMPPHGCVSALAQLGCRKAPFTRTVLQLAVAPDGRNAYASLDGGALMALRRRAAQGALRPLPEPDTCSFASGRRGCRSRGTDAVDIALSGGRRNAYYAFESGVAVLRRGPTGALRQLSGRWACVGTEETPGCTPSRGLDLVNAIALSPDGRNLYVGDYGDGLASVFRRTSDGRLLQLRGSAGCLVGLHGSPIAIYRPYGCKRTLFGDEVNAIAPSPDGRHVYMASGVWPDFGGLHVFVRRQR